MRTSRFYFREQFLGRIDQELMKLAQFSDATFPQCLQVPVVHDAS